MKKRSSPPTQTRRTVFRDVARQRLDDARCLLHKQRRNGAIYLGGYAIECQLKYAACVRKGWTYLPEEWARGKKGHDWDFLVQAGGLAADIDAVSTMANIFAALSDRWSPQLRYQATFFSPDEACRLYSEIEGLYHFLEELVP